MKCVYMSNQECRVRPVIINTNSKKPLFYPEGIIVNKYSGCCNDIINLYVKLCIPVVVKKIDIKVFKVAMTDI